MPDDADDSETPSPYLNDRPLVTYLDDAELRQLLMDLELRFVLPSPLASFTEVDRRESRTSMIYIVSGPGIDTAVVKAGKDWTAEDAERIHEDLVELRGLFEDSDEAEIEVAPVLGWHDSPPSVCMGFVPGDELSELLSRREGYVSADVERAMEHTGAALGLYHRAGVEAVDERSLDFLMIDEALVAMARKVGLMTPPLRGFELRGLVARRYGDFAPYNIRLADDGKVWVFDQPSPPTLAPVHHDVSYFLGRVEGRIGRYESDGRKRRRAVQAGLEAVFLAAYARTGPAPLDRPEDRALIAMYRSHRSLMTARKRISQKRYREVPGYLQSAFRWRLQAS